MTLLARLKAYAPNGASQGLLPQGQGWEASVVLGDTGALRVAKRSTIR